MPRYVTQLGRKNFWHKLRSVRVFGKTVPEFFLGALAKECLMKCKTFFLPPNEKDILAIENVISEMKQTKI